MEDFFNSSLFYTLMIILSLWSALWKGLALWKSAKLGHKVWFVVMFLLNTLGILEIIYLIIYRNKNKSKIAE